MGAADGISSGGSSGREGFPLGRHLSRTEGEKGDDRMRSWTIRLAGAVVVALTLQSSALAQDGGFDLGVRGIITASDGEPANDIPGFGLFGHWRMSDLWSVGFAADRTEYDFEKPAKLVGLRQDPNEEPV